MHKKLEINWTKIKGGCQLARKVVIHNSKSDLPLHAFESLRNTSKCDHCKISGSTDHQNYLLVIVQ